jgi:hypothetical protein
MPVAGKGFCGVAASAFNWCLLLHSGVDYDGTDVCFSMLFAALAGLHWFHKSPAGRADAAVGGDSWGAAVGVDHY